MAVFDGKTLFEKRVLPLKLPFPKNFSIASAVQPFCGNNCFSVALPLWKVTPYINILTHSFLLENKGPGELSTRRTVKEGLYYIF